jgi:L-histidine Nalpha-methyltransferase
MRGYSASGGKRSSSESSSAAAAPRATSDERVRFLVRSREDPLALDGPNVIRGLAGLPKRISAVYVYDKRGTELFERQCDTPEYYLRRAETQLLNAYAAEIFGLCGALSIVELGAGTAEKTRILLAEFARHGVRCDYLPIDVDVETLAESAHELASNFPSLHVHCLGTTYDRGLRALTTWPASKLFLFLGSSLGNMEPPAVDTLLSQIFDSGALGDYLLLGADLDKDPAVIDRAYNDATGFGPRSTLNMLDHLNRRYGGNFNADKFRYRSQYDSLSRRNEVRIESLTNQTVTLASLDFTVAFGAGELIEAEVMLKFDPGELSATLDRAGFSMVQQWIASEYRYGLFLLRRK